MPLRIGGTVPHAVLSPLVGRLRARLHAVRGGKRQIRIPQPEVDLETPALGGAALPLFDSLAPALSLLHKSDRGAPA
ncbi:MAG TPA: hypothetical protein VHP59_03320 [Vineibacter terrae]|nr:hypothetical protein [Vineibacter terrae]